MVEEVKVKEGGAPPKAYRVVVGTGGMQGLAHVRWHSLATTGHAWLPVSGML